MSLITIPVQSAPPQPRRLTLMIRSSLDGFVQQMFSTISQVHLGALTSNSYREMRNVCRVISNANLGSILRQTYRCLDDVQHLQIMDLVAHVLCLRDDILKDIPSDEKVAHLTALSRLLAEYASSCGDSIRKHADSSLTERQIVHLTANMHMLFECLAEIVPIIESVRP